MKIFKMDLQELKYLLDYAKRHDMLNCSFIQVLNNWNKELKEAQLN